MKKHRTAAVFVPFAGCPNKCVFCNQVKITGKSTFSVLEAKNTIEHQISTESNTETQIAFFGGSFTGIPRDLMISLLELAQSYVDANKASSIRISTRPDYINEEVLSILKKYSVKNIELGIQSMFDDVLSLCERGHTTLQSEKAAKMIIDHGFVFGGQMMCSLYGSTKEKDIMTAKKICALGAKETRIYPTVVLKDTKLFALYKSGQYSPPPLEEIIDTVSRIYEIFFENGVKVLRIGLCANEELLAEDESNCIGYHEAIGELALGEIYYRKEKALLLKAQNNKNVSFTVPKNEMSKAVGHKGINKKRLIREFGLNEVRFFEDENLPLFDIKLK